MRILIFSLEFPPNVGGLEWMTYQLAKHFSVAGNQVTAISIAQSHDKEFDTQQPFRIIRIGSAINKGSLIQKLNQKKAMYATLKSEIQTFHPDAILCPHWDPCGYLAWMVSLCKPKVPFFVIGHGTELCSLPVNLPARLIKFFLRWITFTRAKKVFAISHFTSEKIVEIGSLRKNINIIPNGIDNKHIHPKSTEFNIDRGPRLLTICRLVKRKGCDTVIRSLPYLIDKHPCIEYWIAGDGPERSFLDHEVQILQLEGHVHFCGLVSESQKEEIYQTSNIFVMPVRQTTSDFEGFGIVYLEAMAHGIPVIGSTTGGIPDAIENGVTGLLVPPDEPWNIAQAIDELLSDSSKRDSLARAALSRINDRFQWEIIAAEYIKQMNLDA